MSDPETDTSSRIQAEEAFLLEQAELKRNRPFEFITLEFTESVARLTLNRPPYNVLTKDMMEEIARAIEGLHEHREVRALVIQASKECTAFSAGVAVEDSRPEKAFQTLEAFQAVFNAMLDISKPVVTVVDGPAIGGGCELAALGDMIVATPRARFAQPEIRLGVYPPLAAVILPHAIGHKRALEMILTGEPLPATEAARLGLVNRLVPEEKLDEEVEKVLIRITQQSAPVLEMAKKVLYETIGLPLGQALRKSADIYLNQLMDLSDAQEGLRAAVEKRKPVWKDK
ncbi:MAG: enoyl-CoA hydratase/isomerase family protein [Acidobacteria bacterium]|nr:enoyl-CoA hydratase/isomerase family protein [Acidobacteriota bacterium]